MYSSGAVSFVKYAQVGATKTDFDNVPDYIAVMEVTNTTAAKAYLQIFFVAAASVTLGTTVANATISVPASGGAVIPFPGDGWRVGGLAISMAGTTTATGSTEALLDVSIWKKL